MCIDDVLFTPDSPRRLFEQCLGLLEVRRVKPLGEPAIDRGQEVSGCGLLALRLPQAAQAHRRPHLQRPGLLAAGDIESPAKGIDNLSLSLSNLSTVWHNGHP